MNDAQEHRPFSLEGNLGEDFYLLGFNGHEGISKLTNFQLTLVSRRQSQDCKHKPEEIINKEASIRFYVGDQERHIKGYINRFSADFQGHSHVGFHAELVPWLWFLTQTSDCRIFEDKTIPEIIEAVFKSQPFASIAKFTKKLNYYYPKLEYCVQYRETDYNFVCRLMEQAGIFFFFDSSGDGSNSDQLILADHEGAYFDVMESEPIHRSTSTGTHDRGPEITDWEHRYEFVSGQWTHADHSFKEPYLNFETDAKTKISNTLSSEFKKYELYDFPGDFVDSKSASSGTSNGEGVAIVRIGEEEHSFDRIFAGSDCRSFCAGGKFKLTSKRAESDNGKKFAIVSVQHVGSNPGYTTGVAEGTKYSNTFTCLPEDMAFNPPRITPRPTVSGIQTATVIGPQGEEVHCDEYGRIKCLFHWARPKNSDRKQPDDQTSCWVRVAQASAGKKWGFMSIPRIGQEVVVDFLDGNPDRPLVIGSVYNEIQKTAYTLPDDKVKTYFKTNTSPGGEGFNELFFDDKKDAERIFIHAQRDFDKRILNDSRTLVLGNVSQIIGSQNGDKDKTGKQLERVYSDKEINVKRNQVEHIEGNHTMMIGNGEADNGGNMALVVEKQVGILIGEDGMGLTNEGDAKTWIKGAQHVTVDGDWKQKSASLDVTVGGDSKTKASSDISTEAGQDIKTKAGMNWDVDAGMTINVKSGMALNIEAGASLSLKVGGNFININAAGVFIQGTLVNINSGGSASSASPGSPSSPSSPDKPDQNVEEADPTEPNEAHNEETGFKSVPE